MFLSQLEQLPDGRSYFNHHWKKGGEIIHRNYDKAHFNAQVWFSLCGQQSGSLYIKGKCNVKMINVIDADSIWQNCLILQSQ